MELNSKLAHTIVFKLQSALRMMPTTMLASIILLYRKGIAKAQLSQ